MTLGRQFKHL